LCILHSRHPTASDQEIASVKDSELLEKKIMLSCTQKTESKERANVNGNKFARLPPFTIIS